MRHLPPGRHVPHPDAMAAGGQELAVGRERHPADLLVSSEGASSRLVATSQSRTVLSPLPVATVRPSGENVAQKTNR